MLDLNGALQRFAGKLALENILAAALTLAVCLVAVRLLLKLARRRGMELDLPRVVEIPDGIWEDVPLDGEKWKLPGQNLLDRALGPDGDKLLAEWKKLAEEKTK